MSISTLLTIWSFLNGKKTTLGAIILLLAQIAELAGAPEWAPIIRKIHEIVMDLGWGAVVTGLGHKAVKQVKK